MRLSELDDIEKEVLLGKVIERVRADLNDGRPLTEMRTGNDKCSICNRPLIEANYEDDGKGNYAHTHCLDKGVYDDDDDDND